MTSRLMRELGLEDWDKWRRAVRGSPQAAPPDAPKAGAASPRAAPPPAAIRTPASDPKLFALLEELATKARGCTSCKLCDHRTNVAFDRGVRQPGQVLLVGEGPGEQEDLQGLPFVGQAGQLLDLMLATIGLDDATNVNIANVIKCRPPGNRNPEADEIESCLPYLREQIRLLSPRLIVALGKVAAGTLLDSNQSMGDMRAKVHSFEEIPLIATYHPAYLLRSPKQKAKSWDDLVLIKQTLASLPSA